MICLFQRSLKKRKGNSGPPKLTFGRMPGYYDMDDILMEDEVCERTYALVDYLYASHL